MEDFKELYKTYKTLAVKFFIKQTDYSPRGIDFKEYPNKTVDEIAEILIAKEFDEFIEKYYGDKVKFLKIKL